MTDLKKRYKESPEWQEKRRLIRIRDNYTCQDCGLTPITGEVHHLTYQNWGNEPLKDLILLCPKCHKIRHKKKK